MKQTLRHNKILELVKQQGYVSTEQLVEELKVSSQTIRRDLNELAENHLIRRHHGGAATPSTTENSDYIDRKQFFSQQKSCIGQEVAKLIPHGSSLFIDIGTTPEAVAHALLAHQNLRVVTNNLNAAYLLMQKEDFKITLAGGVLRTDGGIIGEATVEFINQFRLDYCILGISAVEADGSMMDYDYHEVQVKKALMRNARQVILVTDHSKFSRNAIVRLGNIRDVDYIVTDNPLPLELSHHLSHSDVVVCVCGE
ncbi:Glycerol-3-phosphate regulon repressor [Bibersteinia trehalosi USDA-ARS-USMARC-188]|uniref:Glycerol-3-phosphate regulon repressor n=5 Tax=Bibersteinia trehalosi TaxID=47735 RepID=W0R808_BIBTR|nr:DeoR/GlpR family transcriptional regulator [Bibersteinia trehalosi]AGH38452.1 Glycerol-3-phosphate regulon repressor [Bibersteinia trehalosi USDA-ARS-USMARC-192]AHG81748.1 Glycerol-3-phosphate regulon repressor [Bibersteinia trehalosi USDA-ARS-USMARC-188]AHG84034.1 Glycerol-3-phosphate regulon repressor [Bibersteinia trehalosi USDA-ARS-USMARC-189]AHG86440.1 Glycerol-3-phosphate regulon repressor [Bibersteinia trehalosi USDA-ARS-USMARC-190]OAQ15051.1 transcriptional regulator [Bibersteinia t